VVVPMMLNAQDLGLGVTKNIPILIIAASCIDNIVAITGHSLVIGLVFDSGQLWWTLIQCPIQICAGIVFGLIAGFFMAIFQIDHSV
jgi:NhaP-type Na+/H+ or K+/H+ antiporter